MPRVIWEGGVSFSPIHITVALHTASREESLSFDMLDRRDFAPVGYDCAFLPAGNTLLLNTLRYTDEELPAEQFAPAAGTLERAKVSQKEFGLALKLVEDMRMDCTAEVVELGELLMCSLAERKRGTAG